VSCGPTAATPHARTSKRCKSAKSTRRSANHAEQATRSQPGSAAAKSGAAKNDASKPATHKHATAGPSNAWLKALRRIGTRRDRKADNYLAFLHLGMIVILTRAF
jgi:hypothetical protein